ncbi:MAG: T9SS type A sorting domain-containing protein [Fibrobacterota bacterium]
MRSVLLLFATLLAVAAFGKVANPVIDTDKSVNATSVSTIIADLIKPGMTDEQKLLALFHYHRRMMHHFRHRAEDNYTYFDLIKTYTVYGSTWCTQQGYLFKSLCDPVFGSTNVAMSDGPGHTSFSLRFNASDKWHWIDPIIGAYAYASDSTIASIDEIDADNTIIHDAVAENRQGTPFFPCATGVDPIAGTGLTAAYSYFKYSPFWFTDTFVPGVESPDFSSSQNPYFTTEKTLQKGEDYLWLWDYLPGDYFNLMDPDPAGRVRSYSVYPPRHICGWKDSLDPVNWPYFKPYKKVIKGDTCYRYYANGIHTFAPDLYTDDPKDAPKTNTGMAFAVDGGGGPGMHPATANTHAEITWRIKLPYPLMSMRLLCNYKKTGASDSLVISMARLYFSPSTSYSLGPRYQDTLSAESYRVIKALPVNAAGTLDTNLRTFVDPINQTNYQTYQGYILKVVMRGANATDVGLDSLKVECIFQHNMFALPQLEPGANQVTLAANGSVTDNLKAGFSWMDEGVQRFDVHDATSTSTAYSITVNQSEMPKMLYMQVGNTLRPDFGIGVEARRLGGLPETGGLELCATPNPFNPSVNLTIRADAARSASMRLAIYDLSGRRIADLSEQAKTGTAIWNASGKPSGIYIARLTAGGKNLTRRITLVK